MSDSLSSSYLIGNIFVKALSCVYNLSNGLIVGKRERFYVSDIFAVYEVTVFVTENTDIVSADFNGSGDIDGYDLAMIRKILIGSYEEEWTNLY